MSVRAERVSAAARLRADGLTQQQIADALGISRSYVSSLLTDPTGEIDRQRKEKFCGSCATCGGRTTYDVGGTARQCQPCRKAAERATKVWTREAVIDAIRRFAAKHGRPPHASDWHHADPVNGYPPSAVVYRNRAKSTRPFATWNEAIAAAGFTPTPSGHYERERRIAARRRVAA